MFDKKILDILVCPKCNGELIHEDDKLICQVCKLKFRIIDDVPDMILEHAEKF